MAKKFPQLSKSKSLLKVDKKKLPKINMKDVAASYYIKMQRVRTKVMKEKKSYYKLKQQTEIMKQKLLALSRR